MSKLTAQLLISSVTLSISLVFLPSVFAARSLNIKSDEPKFTNDEEKEVRVALGGFTEGESIFIKGAFSLPDSTNYFGYTKKGDDWIKNSATSTDQFLVKIGEWDGRLAVKPDLTDTGFKGSGNYNFKVGFYYYSNAGNLSGVNWSNVQAANIDFIPTPTPTAIPTPTDTPVSTSAPTVNPTQKPVPSATPKSQNTPTAYLSPVSTRVIPTITSKVTSTVNIKIANKNLSGAVLGEEVKSSDSANKVTPKSSQENKNNSMPVFLLTFGSGILFITAAVTAGLRKIPKNKTEDKN